MDNLNLPHLHYSWAEELPASTFTRAIPQSCLNPRFEIVNYQLFKELNLANQQKKAESFLDLLSGNDAKANLHAIATAYAGHQYGNFTSLGDGRAILLGEYRPAPAGKLFDIQLKGAGKTLFSRGGDGLATLPTMIKEYVVSNGMAALNIPSTRSLAIVSSDEPVFRDRTYPRAVLTRVAASHIRFGHLEFLAAFGSRQDAERLVSYILDRHFPHLTKELCLSKIFSELVDRYADLIASWQSVGFVHGVMNTDNFLISGETIDYGPCAFMDQFRPNHAFSSIDQLGRYCYRMQPWVARWNLAKLTEVLYPLMNNQEQSEARNAVLNFIPKFKVAVINKFRDKLGLFQQEPEDEKLIQELLSRIAYRHDFTRIFAELGLSNLTQPPSGSSPFSSELAEWYGRWQRRLSKEGRSLGEVTSLMHRSNPWIIPRSHKLREICALSENLDRPPLASGQLMHLMNLLADPYNYSKIEDDYFRPPTPEESVLTTYCGT